MVRGCLRGLGLAAPIRVARSDPLASKLHNSSTLGLIMPKLSLAQYFLPTSLPVVSKEANTGHKER